MNKSQSPKPRLALIAGPTASGKSAIAIDLAVATGGVIVNADASQVYRDLRVLTARPSAADEALAEHRLYGTVDAATPCSAADWAAAARREIAAIQGAGRLPILVGGSGLYIRTLLDGIAPVPSIDADTRAAVRALPVASARAALEAEDPVAAAAIGPRDGARIARALEVIRATGRSIVAWRQSLSGGIGDSVALAPLVVDAPQPLLYERCDGRLAAMVDGGAVEEVAALLARRLDPSLPAMRAIGVAPLAALLRGECDRASALAAAQQATRNYAKRQRTWFRHQVPAAWPRVEAPAQAVSYVENLMRDI
jgi:tRNA dimethylallyltransferase